MPGAGDLPAVVTLDGVLRGRPGLSPVMIGRSSAASQLRDLFDSPAVTATDLPTVALIAGEAGIGKSRLVREFLAGLPSGTNVLCGYGEPGAMSRSLSLLHDVVGPLGADPSDLPRVVDAVRSSAADRRTVLVLEDLHWADADSAAVIDRLVTHPWPGTLVIGTYRPDDLSRRLPGGDLLARLERRVSVERVHLDRLSRSDVTAFLTAVYGDAPGSAVIEALYNRTGGNPFFLEELLTCCAPGSAAELVSVPLPWSLQEVVQQQLDGLEPVARHVAEVAAVCGPASRFDVLAEVAGLEEGELIAVLRHLIQRDVLVETGAERFVFRHALVRDAVETGLLGRQRRRLHERALEALRRTGGSADELAHHAVRAEHYDEFVHLARTGSQEFLEAGQTFSALRLADEALAEEPDDHQLLYVATRSAWLAGLPDEAAAYAARWLAAAEATDDPNLVAAPLRWGARIDYDRDEPEGEAALMERLVGLLDQLSGVERAQALAWVAQNRMLHHDDAEAVAYADRAIEEAERIGDKGVAIQARIERGSALVMTAHASATAELMQAVDEAEAAGEWVLATRGLNNLFDSVPVSSPEGRELMDRFRSAAERAGFDLMATAVANLRLAELAHDDADLEAVHRYLEPLNWNAAFLRKEREWLTAWQFHVAAEEGCVGLARTHFESLARVTGCVKQDWLDRLALELAALEGALDEGRRLLGAIVARPPGHTAFFVRETVNLVEQALRLGLPAAELRPLLDGWLADHPSWPRVATIVDGLLLGAEDHPAESAARLLTALSNPDPWLPRHLVEYLRVQAAHQVLRTGDRTGAKALVDQALAGLAKWPGWKRDEAEALARRLDGRTGSDGVLSAREREVAVLLAEGITNAELAKRLYISPKTAAVHVSNILMKLNMASRAEVAAWAVRSGLVGPGQPGTHQ